MVNDPCQNRNFYQSLMVSSLEQTKSNWVASIVLGLLRVCLEPLAEATIQICRVGNTNCLARSLGVIVIAVSPSFIPEFSD